MNKGPIIFQSKTHLQQKSLLQPTIIQSKNHFPINNPYLKPKSLLQQKNLEIPRRTIVIKYETYIPSKKKIQSNTPCDVTHTQIAFMMVLQKSVVLMRHLIQHLTSELDYGK